LPEGVPVYLDESLRRFETVYPACGSGNSAIELTLAELEEYSPCAGWVDVCDRKLETTTVVLDVCKSIDG
jgi:prolyl-tRNA editing enzyme YbaK/EbsC (Cys-tRNA(Pro) deacylase)